MPAFAALAQVQDKVSAYRTLARLGVPQPPAIVAASAAEVEAAEAQLAGVAAIREDADRHGVGGGGAQGLAGRAAAGRCGLRAARGVRGRKACWSSSRGLARLAMVQAVFTRGELGAFGACAAAPRGRRGAGPATSSAWTCRRRGSTWPGLGAALDWHGALSADVILGPDGPRFIDINPRLVEPVNALACGVDLAGTLVEVAGPGSAQPQPTAGCLGRGPISSCSRCSARPSTAVAGEVARRTRSYAAGAPRDYRGSQEGD